LGIKKTHENNASDDVQPQRRQQRKHNIPKNRIRKNVAKRQRPIRFGEVLDTLERKKERCHLQSKKRTSGPEQPSKKLEKKKQRTVI
jgi:hypothetical protein